MRWNLVTGWLALPAAMAQTYNYGFNTDRITRRQDTGPIVVSRLPLGSQGSIPNRLEIRELKKDQYSWNLYILALSLFHFVDQSHPLSFYEIAGIHGVPFRPWNGVNPVQGANLSGYCTHSSVLFPTWHRPYLTLYEQEVYKLVNAIAGLFTDETERNLYKTAASNFRIPYWDWSIAAPSGDTHLPDVFWSPVISQYGPNGMQNIRNPLYSYIFHPLVEDDLIWAPMKFWNETKRAPDTKVSSTAPPSRNDQVSAALLTKLPEIQQRLYILFSKYHDFNSFSNKAWAASQKSSSLDSIESVHDIIHVYGGSKGHMTYVPLSSFDPLFFLHHAMTDRLVSMWQILNPSAWIAPMPAGETTFTALKGTIQTSSTALTPFFSSIDGKFWTSDDARTTEAFGYYYADTAPAGGDNEAFRQALIRKINAWYGPSSPAGIQGQEKDKSKGKATPSAKNKATSKKSSTTAPQRPSLTSRAFQPNIKLSAMDPPIDKIVQDGEYVEWIANVQVNVEALDGRFGVHFFIGTPPESIYSWNTAQNHVGSVAIFAMDRSTGSQSKISGTVPLTRALMKVVTTGMLQNLDASHVVSFLKERLEMRVLGSSDTIIPSSEVDGLQVDIASAVVKLPNTESELPHWDREVIRMQVWKS